MIRKISFSNFFSFKDETTIDFTVDKNAPDSGSYVKSQVDDARISIINFVFGHNASGKTNLLKAISFIKWFAVESFKLTPDSQIPFSQFGFCSEKNPTMFAIEFENASSIFLYSFGLTPEHVISEKLQMKFGGNKQKLKFKTIFSRELKNNLYAFNLRNFDLKISESNFSQTIRRNASIISTAFQFNSKLSREIVDYFHRTITNVVLEGRMAQGKELQYQFETIKFFNENPKMKDLAEKIVKKFDLGLEKIQIDKKENTDDKKIEFEIKGIHKVENDKTEYSLPFPFESAGTQNLWFQMRNIISAIHNGGVAVLDEIDNDLHPLVMSELVQIISSESENSHNAQFICSSHSLPILNLLDKQQIILVEKDRNGISQSWKLSDIKGIRADDNYYAKYLAGAYGAVPQI